jgi:hypothetical protein
MHELANFDELLQVTPVGVLARLETGLEVAAAFAILAGTAGAAAWRHRRRVAATIEVSGMLVDAGIQRALRGESEDNRNPDGRQTERA